VSSSLLPPTYPLLPSSSFSLPPTHTLFPHTHSLNTQTYIYIYDTFSINVYIIPPGGKERNERRKGGGGGCIVYIKEAFGGVCAMEKKRVTKAVWAAQWLWASR
jgi:hypothetical protein